MAIAAADRRNDAISAHKALRLSHPLCKRARGTIRCQIVVYPGQKEHIHGNEQLKFQNLGMILTEFDKH